MNDYHKSWLMPRMPCHHPQKTALYAMHFMMPEGRLGTPSLSKAGEVLRKGVGVWGRSIVGGNFGLLIRAWSAWTSSTAHAPDPQHTCHMWLCQCQVGMSDKAAGTSKEVGTDIIWIINTRGFSESFKLGLLNRRLNAR